MEEMNKRIIKIEQPSKKSSFEIEMKNTENIKHKNIKRENRDTRRNSNVSTNNNLINNTRRT